VILVGMSNVEEWSSCDFCVMLSGQVIMPTFELSFRRIFKLIVRTSVINPWLAGGER